MTDARQGGRPTKLTLAVQRKICSALRKGNFRKTAARFAGVQSSTLRAWMDRGRRSRSGIYRDFYLAVEAAEVNTEVEMVGLQLRDARKDPKQRRWWLTHRHRARWADNMQNGKLELTGKDGGPLKIEDARGTLDAKLEAMLAKRVKPKT